MNVYTLPYPGVQHTVYVWIVSYVHRRVNATNLSRSRQLSGHVACGSRTLRATIHAYGFVVSIVMHRKER